MNFTQLLPMLTYQLAFSLPPTKFHIRVPWQPCRAIHHSHQSLCHQFNRLIIDPILAIMEPILPWQLLLMLSMSVMEKDSITDSLRSFRIPSLPLKFFITSRVQGTHLEEIWAFCGCNQWCICWLFKTSKLMLIFTCSSDRVFLPYIRKWWIMGAVTQLWSSDRASTNLSRSLWVHSSST